MASLGKTFLVSEDKKYSLLDKAISKQERIRQKSSELLPSVGEGTEEVYFTDLGDPKTVDADSARNVMNQAGDLFGIRGRTGFNAPENVYHPSKSEEQTFAEQAQWASQIFKVPVEQITRDHIYALGNLSKEEFTRLVTEGQGEYQPEEGVMERAPAEGMEPQWFFPKAQAAVREGDPKWAGDDRLRVQLINPETGVSIYDELAKNPLHNTYWFDPKKGDEDQRATYELERGDAYGAGRFPNYRVELDDPNNGTYKIIDSSGYTRANLTKEQAEDWAKAYSQLDPTKHKKDESILGIASNLANRVGSSLLHRIAKLGVQGHQALTAQGEIVLDLVDLDKDNLLEYSKDLHGAIAYVDSTYKEHKQSLDNPEDLYNAYQAERKFQESTLEWLEYSLKNRKLDFAEGLADSAALMAELSLGLPGMALATYDTYERITDEYMRTSGGKEPSSGELAAIVALSLASVMAEKVALKGMLGKLPAVNNALDAAFTKSPVLGRVVGKVLGITSVGALTEGTSGVLSETAESIGSQLHTGGIQLPSSFEVAEAALAEATPGAQVATVTGTYKGLTESSDEALLARYEQKLATPDTLPLPDQDMDSAIAEIERIDDRLTTIGDVGESAYRDRLVKRKEDLQQQIEQGIKNPDALSPKYRERLTERTEGLRVKVEAARAEKKAAEAPADDRIDLDVKADLGIDDEEVNEATIDKQLDAISQFISKHKEGDAANAANVLNAAADNENVTPESVSKIKQILNTLPEETKPEDTTRVLHSLQQFVEKFQKGKEIENLEELAELEESADPAIQELVQGIQEVITSSQEWKALQTQVDTTSDTYTYSVGEPVSGKGVEEVYADITTGERSVAAYMKGLANDLLRGNIESAKKHLGNLRNFTGTQTKKLNTFYDATHTYNQLVDTALEQGMKNPAVRIEKIGASFTVMPTLEPVEDIIADKKELIEARNRGERTGVSNIMYYSGEMSDALIEQMEAENAYMSAALKVANKVNDVSTASSEVSSIRSNLQDIIARVSVEEKKKKEKPPKKRGESSATQAAQIITKDDLRKAVKVREDQSSDLDKTPVLAKNTLKDVLSSIPSETFEAALTAAKRKCK